MKNRLLVLGFLFLVQGAHAKTLNVRLSEVPYTLDWNNQVMPDEAPIVANLCEGLYTVEYPSRKVVPGIAESVKRSADFTEYTFTLRKDAKWSDGKPILAQNFVDSWLRVISPQSGSNYGYYLFDIVNAKDFSQGKIFDPKKVGVRAVDDRTLSVKLKTPQAHWEDNITFWPFFPIRKELIEKFANNWWHAGVLVSSGPFVLESYQPGLRMVLKRNPFYTRFKSNVDEIDIQFISDFSKALQKYESKEFQVLSSIPFSEVDKLKNRKDFRLSTMMREHQLSINVQRYPMNGRDFRLAILSAIDYTKLLSQGLIQMDPAASIIPPPLLGFSKKRFLGFNLKAAKEYLKKSGVKVDSHLKLDILASTSEPFASIATSVKDQIEKNLGITVNLSLFPNASLTNYKNLMDFHLIAHTHSQKLWQSQDFLFPYSTEGMKTERHYSNSIYDEWVDQGCSEMKPKEREHDFYEAQRFLIQSEGVMSPLFYEHGSYLVQPTIKDVYFNPMGFFIFKDAKVE